MTNKYDEAAQDKLVEEMKAKFGANFWVKPGNEWSKSAVLWSGEGAIMPDGTPAFDSMAYERDPQEKLYVMGVHKDLVKWIEAKGLFWEANDAGTYLAYPI